MSKAKKKKLLHFVILDLLEEASTRFSGDLSLKTSNEIQSQVEILHEALLNGFIPSVDREQVIARLKQLNREMFPILTDFEFKEIREQEKS